MQRHIIDARGELSKTPLIRVCPVRIQKKRIALFNQRRLVLTKRFRVV